MGRPKSPKRTRKYNERTCICNRCAKVCNSTPGKRHRHCTNPKAKGTWE